MKSARDDAALRFGAIHPAMSYKEHERAATHISRGWTLPQIEAAEEETQKKLARAERDAQIAALQLLVLKRAREFQQRCEPPS
jgi:hypothetical protein